MAGGEENGGGRPAGEEPRSPIDVIVATDGVMPPARMFLRAGAFLLDYLLIAAVAITVIARVVIPSSYPGTVNDFLEEWVRYFDAVAGEEAGDGEAGGEEAISEEWRETFQTVQEVVLLVMWLYFGIGEGFFRGSSLGKRIFRLRSTSLVTLGPPGIFAGFVRAALKSFVVMYWIPLLLVDLLPLLFNKRGQLGHDLLTRTFVLDERRVKEG